MKDGISIRKPIRDVFDIGAENDVQHTLFAIGIIVVKRSGQRVAFNGTKIAIAIKSSFDDLYETYDENKVNNSYISFSLESHNPSATWSGTATCWCYLLYR